METFILYWGPTLVALAVVVVVIRAALARQARYFRTHTDNTAAQTAELSKIHRSLERIASALEASGRP
jgi:hypothetical protein